MLGHCLVSFSRIWILMIWHLGHWHSSHPNKTTTNFLINFTLYLRSHSKIAGDMEDKDLQVPTWFLKFTPIYVAKKYFSLYLDDLARFAGILCQPGCRYLPNLKLIIALFLSCDRKITVGGGDQYPHPERWRL